MRDGFFYLIRTQIMDSFFSSPLNTLFYIRKNMKTIYRNPEYTEMRHVDGWTCGQHAAVVRLFTFYLSNWRVRLCEINRIHYWCSVGTEKYQPQDPTFQWETRLAEFPTERWTRGLGFFLEPLNINDRFFFSYTNSTFSDDTVPYSIIWTGNIAEVDVYSQ